jgi:Glycosyl hydrolase family 47
MMRHAWKNYANFAWGDNELEPVSRSGFVGQAHLGGAKLGLTIIDSLDTLYLMGMQAELANATDWIKNHFNISKAVYN